MEIYDQVWCSREGNLSNGHSQKATSLVQEILDMLQSKDGTADCFPYELIEALSNEYDIDVDDF